VNAYAARQLSFLSFFECGILHAYNEPDILYDFITDTAQCDAAIFQTIV